MKIHHSLAGQHRFLKYEELIDDWLVLAVLEAGKRRPALKNNLIGDASMYKGLLDRETLRSQGGVKYFKDTLRPTSSMELGVFSSGDVFQFIRARRENMEMIQWIVNFQYLSSE